MKYPSHVMNFAIPAVVIPVLPWLDVSCLVYGPNNFRHCYGV
jgi:hypothetical protein